MSKLGEWILLKFSRHVSEPDCIAKAEDKWDIQTALGTVSEAFPEFIPCIKGKRVLDYGCGPGWQSVAMALNGAAAVTGLDIYKPWREHARRRAEQYGVSERVRFQETLPESAHGEYDIVLSQDSFEHYPDPQFALSQMKKALCPGGRIFIVFSWPWFSPLGSHMQIFTLIPWVNLLFTEKTIMSVRARYRNDGATRYEDVESGLNKMTVAKFERIIRASDLTVVKLFLRGFKNWRLLTRIPALRELFTQQVGCVLSLPECSG